MKPIIILALALLPILGKAQSQSEKMDTIIFKLDLLTIEKDRIFASYIEPLKDQLSESDRVKLINIENSLTDSNLYDRLNKGLSTLFSSEEVNDLYNFVISPAFHKFSKPQTFEQAMTKGFADIYAELDSLENKIQDFSPERKDFIPIPVERSDGFYAVKNYTQSIDLQRVELVNDAAVNSRDIEHVEEDFDYAGNRVLNIRLKKDGAERFFNLTRLNNAKPIAIVVDKKIVALPVINEPIKSGKLTVVLNFSEEAIKEIVARLGNASAL
ncbi:hypothetical protein H8S90_13695 [Olivibacter sp. SDN3]|uniref:SecDF P1 head subdomain-containing protein n=1 Tax=Olivibacter sp. SDN3 TaxID=2764720 RepID=UPI0016513530|nr:hypothetical protein [Olivibacter sp. SDN3]QNL47873.1 hypothetical protein H8S90_13695 [Olivibacter sp. SDN3]